MGVYNAVTPEQIYQQIDLEDFQTKATLMALGSSAFTGDLDKLAADFEKVTPELRSALITGLNMLHIYLGELLEKIDPESEAETEEWPDVFEEAKREITEG